MGEHTPKPEKTGKSRLQSISDKGKRRIGELLIDEGLITPQQLQEALDRQREQGGKTVENLIALEHLDAHAFLRFLSKQPGVASIDLLNYTIAKEIIALVPTEFALKHEVVPIDKLGRDLTVGMACPLDAASIAELEKATGLRVRPLLVSMNDVRVALKRYYAPKEAKPAQVYDAGFARTGGDPSTLARVESALTLEGIMALVRDVKALPALPETVKHVREAMDDPNTSTKDVAAIIARDPALSAKMLSLANSAGYGFSQKVETVEMATTLLGLRETYSIVLSSAVINYFDRSKTFDYTEYWRKSTICATSARIIAQTIGYKQPQSAYTAGLLHDIGRLVFAEIMPERYNAVKQTVPDNEVVAAEEEHFGVAHPEIGYLLATEWNLPEEVSQAIRLHHRPAEAQLGQTIVNITALASMMTDAYGRLNRDNVRQFASMCKPLLDRLGMSEQDYIGVLGETAKNVRELLQYLGNKAE